MGLSPFRVRTQALSQSSSEGQMRAQVAARRFSAKMAWAASSQLPRARAATNPGTS
jgi:hypothetical protein